MKSSVFCLSSFFALNLLATSEIKEHQKEKKLEHKNQIEKVLNKKNSTIVDHNKKDHKNEHKNEHKIDHKSDHKNEHKEKKEETAAVKKLPENPVHLKLNRSERDTLYRNLEKTREDIEENKRELNANPSDEELKEKLLANQIKEQSIVQRIEMGEGKGSIPSTSLPAMIREASSHEALNSLPKISAIVDVQYQAKKDYNKVETSQITPRTMELHLDKELNDIASASIGVIYEEGITALSIKNATVSINIIPELTLKAGRDDLPFGTFKSEFATYPLTYDAAFGNDSYAELYSHIEMFKFGVYTLKGHSVKGTKKKQLSTLGAFITADYKFDPVAINAGFYYINNIASTTYIDNYMSNNVSDMAENTPGAIANLDFIFDNIIHWNNEYLYTDRFNNHDLSYNNRGAKLGVFKTELSYHFDIMDRKHSVQLGYQMTQELKALNLPKSRFSLGATHYIAEGVKISAEYMWDKDYNTGDCDTTGTSSCGTGNKGNLFVISTKFEY